MNDESQKPNSPGPLFHESDVFSPFRCQKLCPGSVNGGFCGARIDPSCLRIGPDGVVRVGISASPQEWFGAIHQCGAVLHLARNAVTVLGEVGSFPVLTNWNNPVLPSDQAGLYAPNLAEYASLWAFRETSPVGPLYGLEAYDAVGRAFERVVLTASAHREHFERFVIDHQSPPEEAGCWYSPNHSFGAQRSRMVENRRELLRSLRARGATYVSLLPQSVIPNLLTAVIKENFQIRTTSYSRALIRGAVWAPDGPCVFTHQEEGTPFLFGNNMGLHINYAALGEIWLWQGICMCCGKHRWTVEVSDLSGAVALALNAGSDEIEAQWRDLLTVCFQ
jgi:hypothetical protein